MNKRILVVCRNFWPEEVKITDICRGLSFENYRIDVLCGQPSSQDGEFIKGYDSFRVRRESHDRLDIYRTVDVKRGERSNIRLFLYYVSFPVLGTFLIKKLLNKKYEAVLIYQMSPVMMAGPGIRIASKLGIPVYVYAAQIWPESLFDEMDVRSPAFRKILYKISDRYYRKASSIIVGSERMKKYLSDRLCLTGSDVFLVPSFPETCYLYPAEADLSLREKMAGSFSLMIFENENEKMDCVSIITAAKMVRSDAVRNIRFVVTGDGEDVKKLKHLTKKEDLYEYFFFEGKTAKEDIGKYINLADVLMHIVMPSEAGEYAISEMLINCLAAGKPLIASDSGAGKELIRTSGCAVSAAALDGENLYNCIMKIYRMSPDQRADLGENARKYQAEHFDPETGIQLISDILNGNGPKTKEENSGIRNLWDPD